MYRLTVFIGLLLAPALWAQQVASEKFTARNGFTGNYFTALLQDSRGFIWAGTDEGLNRYDGLLVKKYNQLGAGGLTDLRINCLAEDGEGNIWVGTEYGLNRIDPRTETITRYFEGTGAGAIPYRWCNALYTDSRKRLWLTTEKGISRYNAATNSFVNFPVKLYGSDPTINKFIQAVYEDKQDIFWLPVSYGLRRFNPENNQVATYVFPGNETAVRRENTMLCVTEEDENNLLIGTWGGALLRFNRQTGIFSKPGLSGFEVKMPVVFAIQPAGNGKNKRIWLATNLGTFLFEKKENGDYQNLSAQTQWAGFLPLAETRALLNDRQQNLWLAATNGLYKLGAENKAVQWLPLPAGKTDQVFHLISDTSAGTNKFFLTTTSGWYFFNRADQTLTPYPLPAAGGELLRNINRWQLTEKGLWFTSMKGFGFFNRQHPTVVDYSRQLQAGTEPIATGHILQDDQGRFWLTLRRNGIRIFNAQTGEVKALFDKPDAAVNIFGQDVLSLVKGADGFIYFTSRYRFYQVNPRNFSVAAYSAPLHNEGADTIKTGPDKIYLTASGRMLVTGRHRIYEWKNGQLAILFPQQGLSDFEVEKLAETGNGTFWALTSKGIFLTDSAFHRWKPVYAPGENEFNNITEIMVPEKGLALVAGTGRIGLLNESLLPQSGEMPPVLFSRVKTGEKEHYLFSANNRLRVSYKNAVEVELAACNYAAAQETALLYRLDGWDAGWKTVSATPVIRYEQLPPGNYTFRAKTRNSEGIESRESVFYFTVVPPFYRTGWFILACAALTITLAWLFYRYRLRKAVELEKLRTRIATDLHDDLGATLSSISMYSETLKNQVKEKLPHLEPVLNRMGENSREMVAGISDIVWAINPGNDDGARLLQRMESYATDICAARQVQLEFAADGGVAKTRFQLEHRKNIYLIFKEAVNNAVKYAGAEKIKVEITLNGKQLKLSVTDNGRGFDPENATKGNGLKNMQLRAGEIKGKLAIRSIVGEGTTVELQCML